MAKKGRVGWIPLPLDLELDDIQRENRLPRKADAAKDLVKYARVGREFERIMKLDFSRKKRLPDVEEMLGGKKRGKR